MEQAEWPMALRRLSLAYWKSAKWQAVLANKEAKHVFAERQLGKDFDGNVLSNKPEHAVGAGNNKLEQAVGANKGVKLSKAAVQAFCHSLSNSSLVNVFCSVDKTLLFGSASVGPGVIDAALRPPRKATPPAWCCSASALQRHTATQHSQEVGRSRCIRGSKRQKQREAMSKLVNQERIQALSKLA
ncbi:hypothetical protein FA09DRAFT_324199 [Tilletiopsis washingtonensis]|uniref:Uncharacterized protein n=1 Tax=Tilletiopsis washingtonensis TaxID=58919 RepID=A0A316ZK95_9BASI|nr:hypothetical protein FA09DRAFT_324199 [Tilletiopsis washingtonensis]PWO01433.1 hypothetical protein FA09DRAFT_324199 [Tilletiopsis washingtonensis]